MALLFLSLLFVICGQLLVFKIIYKFKYYDYDYDYFYDLIAIVKLFSLLLTGYKPFSIRTKFDFLQWVNIGN